MLPYIARRLLFVVPTLLGVTLIVFAISKAAPGDPLASQAELAGQAAPSSPGQSARDIRTRLYGLDKPIWSQYVDWLAHMARLDFGDSIKHRQPVIALIKQRLPVTLTLNVIALALVYALAVPLGILSARWHNRLPDRIISLILIALWSVPIMWVGQLLIVYFAGPEFRAWFPPAGLSSLGADQWPFFPWLADRLHHLVLPVLCLAYPQLAYLAKQFRAAVLENLHSRFVTTARAKGLSESAILLRHVLPNSLVPILTLMGTLLPAVIGGSVIVEKLFSIPGMGLLLFEAVSNRDYNVIMAVATFAAVLNVLGLLLADIACAIVDPRISLNQGQLLHA